MLKSRRNATRLLVAAFALCLVCAPPSLASVSPKSLAKAIVAHGSPPRPTSASCQRATAKERRASPFGDTRRPIFTCLITIRKHQALYTVEVLRDGCFIAERRRPGQAVYGCGVAKSSASAVAASAHGGYITLLVSQQLHAWPEPSAPVSGTVSSRDFLGRPTIARVLSSISASGQRWLRLDACNSGASGCRGWVPASATVPASGAAPLSHYALGRISAQANAMDASVVIVNADDDLSLYERSADRVQSLASVTKIFVTGLALRLWGLRVSPLLAEIMIPSNNELAASLNGRVGGSNNVNAYADSLGAAVHTEGGNGLDPASRASATQTVRFLLAMRHQQHFGSWEQDLPLAGHTGTLSGRMVGTAADGRCYAKTGTLIIPINVSDLAGYCRAAHHNVAFAIFTRSTDLARAHAAQDAILATLVASY